MEASWSWELAVLVAVVLTAAAARWGGPPLAARLKERLPARLWELPARWPMGLDLALAGLCALVSGHALWRVWETLTPHRAPTGPDYENYTGAALAFETGRWDLYYDDRYPGFPWLVSVFSEGPVDALATGTALSMALTALAAMPLYFIGRALAGRAAGVAGALLGQRLAVVVDIGHSYTHYPLTATLDLSLLALGLGALLSRSLPRAALALGLQVALGTLAIASDPKQLPLVLGLVGLTGLGVAALGPGRAPPRAGLALAGLLPLPIAHALVARYHLGLLSLEGLTIRTPLRFTDREALKAVKEEGWALGGPEAWSRLWVSFERVATNVLPKTEGGVDPAFLDALPRVFPETSMAWGSALLILPALWLWRGQGRLPQRAAALALLGVFCASAVSPVRVHYAHRYALPYFQAAPVGVSAAIGLAIGGPAALASGAVSLLAGPYGAVDTSFLDRDTRSGDIWIGFEKGQDLVALDWALEHLPPETGIFDFGEREALPALAAGFPYWRCATAPGTCAEAMATHEGPRVAVLRVNDRVSVELPGGDHERLRADRYGRMPEAIAGCWARAFMPGPGLGLYHWSCEGAPGAHGAR